MGAWWGLLRRGAVGLGVALLALGLALLVGLGEGADPSPSVGGGPTPLPTRLAPGPPTPTPTPTPSASTEGPVRFRLEVEPRGPLSYSLLLSVRVRAPLLARLTNEGTAPARGVVIRVQGWVGARPVHLNGAPLLEVPVGDLAPGATAEVPVDLEVGMGLGDLGPARQEGVRFRVQLVWSGGQQALPDILCTLEGCASLQGGARTPRWVDKAMGRAYTTAGVPPS